MDMARYVHSKWYKKTKTLTAKRQIDLKKKVDRFKLMVDEGYYADENISIKTWIETWLDVITKPSVKKKTLDNYADRLRYVIEKFGERKLKTLAPLELRKIFLMNYVLTAEKATRTCR